jgi:hypothetical protein
MKRTLQLVLALLSLMPLTVGTLGFIYGAALFAPAAGVTPKLDSQYRFVAAWDVGLAFIVWWIIPQIERQTVLFRLICMVVFVGGCGRVVAWLVVGSPGTAFLAVTGLELLIPLLIPWQSKVATHASSESATAGARSFIK